MRKLYSSGFLMIEAMLALVIVALLLMTLRPARQLNEDSRYAVAVADAFERADVMASAWVVKHMGVMMRTGPTTQDLDASAVAVAVGVSDYDNARLPRGMTLRMRATLVPAGCTGLSCSVEWLVYSNGGLPFSPGLVAQIQRALGARSATSTVENPSVLTGWHARWTVANPVGAVANTIATRGVYSQTSVAQGIRVDGTSELASDWKVGESVVSVNSSLADKVSVSGTGTLGDACTIPNSTTLSTDNTTTLACVGGVWVVTHAATKNVVGTTTNVVGY